MAFVGVVVAVLIPAAMMLNGWIGDSVRDLERESLTREAKALASALALAEPPDIPEWVAHLDATARVTVIDGDGRVLGDTDVPAAALPLIENHGGRPEVRAAMAG